MTAPKKRPRPIRCPGYVWCDHHGSIHEAKWDVYEEEGRDQDWSKEPPECSPKNWRGVYVMGQKGEFS